MLKRQNSYIKLTCLCIGVKVFASWVIQYKCNDSNDFINRSKHKIVKLLHSRVCGPAYSETKTLWHEKGTRSYAKLMMSVERTGMGLDSTHF